MVSSLIGCRYFRPDQVVGFNWRQTDFGEYLCGLFADVRAVPPQGGGAQRVPHRKADEPISALRGMLGHLKQPAVADVVAVDDLAQGLDLRRRDVVVGAGTLELSAGEGPAQLLDQAVQLVDVFTA